MDKKLLVLISVIIVAVAAIAGLTVYVMRPSGKPVMRGSDPSAVFAQAESVGREALALAKQGRWTDSIGKYESALALLNEISSRFPSWQVDKVEGARAEFRKNADRVDAVRLNTEALKLFHARMYDKSKVMYTEYLEKYGEKFNDMPTTAAAWYHMGFLERLEGNTDNALRAFDRVISDYQGDKYLHFISGSRFGKLLIYQSQGQFDKAEAMLSEIMGTDPVLSSKLNVMFEISPIRNWQQDLGGSFPLVMEFLCTYMPEKEFIDKVGTVTPALKNDALFFVGLRAYLADNPAAAKKAFERCLANAADRESLGYRLSIAFMRKLTDAGQ